MAFREELDETKLVQILSESKGRNSSLTFGTTKEDFKDPTFFLKDSRNNGLLAFSLRGRVGDRGTFWEGSFGTTEAQTDGNTRYNEAASLEALTEAFKIAAERWPGVPFSCAFGDRCPWVRELVIGKGPRRSDDYTAIDICIKTLTSLGVRMVKLDPPERLTVSIEGGVVDLGLIYCHSTPLLVDRR